MNALIDYSIILCMKHTVKYLLIYNLEAITTIDYRNRKAHFNNQQCNQQFKPNQKEIFKIPVTKSSLIKILKIRSTYCH